MNEALQEIMKRSKSYEEADFLSTIFGKFRDEAVKGTVPVVLFGAGSAGKELYPIFKMHGINPVCFCDNNPSRVGSLYCGLPVISQTELYQKFMDSLVVVTTGAFRDEIKQQLIENGFYFERILTVSNQEAMCYYSHLAQWYWSEEDLHLYENELLEVYNLLSDQKSKEIFVSRIALFVRGADYQSFCKFISKLSDVSHKLSTNFQDSRISTNYDSEAYLQFNNDLICLDENEILIDGGAYTGDSTFEFIKANIKKGLKYRKIVCYEPDPKIFTELQKNTADYSNIVLKPFGLWSKASIIKFAGSNVLRPGSTKIISEKENTEKLSTDSSGITEISTISIDDDLTNDNVTIIKMDIEGAEIDALSGAKKTITNCRPKLIISAYHKRNDLFEIPLLIHQMVPDHKIFFRHFSSNFGETTLFAIP